MGVICSMGQGLLTGVWGTPGTRITQTHPSTDDGQESCLPPCESPEILATVKSLKSLFSSPPPPQLFYCLYNQWDELVSHVTFLEQVLNLHESFRNILNLWEGIFNPEETEVWTHPYLFCPFENNVSFLMSPLFPSNLFFSLCFCLIVFSF